MQRQQVSRAQRHARNAEFEDLEDAPEPRRGGPAATASTPRGGSPRSASARRAAPQGKTPTQTPKGAKIRRVGGGARAAEGSYSRQPQQSEAPGTAAAQQSSQAAAEADAASVASSMEAAPQPMPLPPKPSNAPDELELKMTRELKELKAELDALERTLAVSARFCCNVCDSTGHAFHLLLRHCAPTFCADTETHQC